MTIECMAEQGEQGLHSRGWEGRSVEPLGVILLDADHSVETLDQSDPFAWEPPAGLGEGFVGHPAFWPVPAIFAVANGATGVAAAEGTSAAIQGVVDAVRRLDGHCRMIVGSCGFFGDAWAALDPKPSTPTILSALDALDDALRWSGRDVAVLSMTTVSGRRSVAHRSDVGRIRVIGVDGAGHWARLGRSDWVTARDWTLEGLEAGLREVLERCSMPGGQLADVGALVLECTVLPQFLAVIREFTDAPIVDIGGLVRAYLAEG